jgi:hypothetical protein
MLGQRVHKTAVAIAFVLLTAWLLVGVWQSLRHQPARNTADQSSIKIENGPDKITDWLLVTFNCLLVVSTVMLWGANNRSARIAERALTELERPFLGVEVLQSGLSFTETGTVTSPISDFKYQFVNYGRTPARLTELVETWPVIKRINEKEDGSRYSYTSVLPDPIDPTRQSGRKLPFGVVVSSGKPYPLTANAFTVIDIQNLTVQPWYHGTGSDLYFCGYVRYTDIFNKRYILGFCAIFDYTSRHFVLMGDDRYNYNREEA